MKCCGKILADFRIPICCHSEEAQRPKNPLPLATGSNDRGIAAGKSPRNDNQ